MTKAKPPQCLAIVGLQYGDEGKGKIVDMLAQRFDAVVRWNGGPNAGHTVYVGDKKFGLHQVPSGVFEDKILFIGPECYVDIEKLRDEIIELVQAGYYPKIFLDDAATVIEPSHIEIDSSQFTSGIKTTGRGIGPCAAARSRRNALRVCDILKKGAEFLPEDVWSPSKRDWVMKVKYILPELKPYITPCQTWALMNNMLSDGKRFLFEGAQSIALDNIHGEYPYVSQRCMAGNIFSSFGMHKALRDMAVIGIMKAYTTRSGSGRMITEMDEPTAETIRHHGKEYGVTTKRPRRIGWLDLVQVKKAIVLSGASEIILTKVDILKEAQIAEPQVCTSYIDTQSGIHLAIPPTILTIKYQADYEKLPPISDISTEGVIPFAAIIQRKLQTLIRAVSYGPGKHDIFIKG